MPISRQIGSAISGHKKKIQSKQALKKAREMVESWGAEEKPKPKPKAKPKAATEAGGTVLEEGRRTGIYKKKKTKKKKTTASAGWSKGRWYNRHQA